MKKYIQIKIKKKELDFCGYIITNHFIYEFYFVVIVISMIKTNFYYKKWLVPINHHMLPKSHLELWIISNEKDGIGRDRRHEWFITEKEANNAQSLACIIIVTGTKLENKGRTFCFVFTRKGNIDFYGNTGQGKINFLESFISYTSPFSNNYFIWNKRKRNGNPFVDDSDPIDAKAREIDSIEWQLMKEEKCKENDDDGYPRVIKNIKNEKKNWQSDGFEWKRHIKNNKK